MDFTEYGGAPLLGVNGVCIVCHGRSDSKAIFNAIRVALQLSKNKVNEHICFRTGKRQWERRPLVLVRAVTPSGNGHSVVLQNAETIRLVGPAGGTRSISRLAPGDEVLLAEGAAGRHFGVAVEETIREK